MGTKARIALAVAVSAFVGLAIVGWGGIEPFLVHPARVALLVLTLGMAVAALFTEGNLSPGEREDRGNRWVLVAFALLGIGVAFLPAYTDRHSILTLDGDSVRWAGVVLYGVGGVLRLWPVFVLGRRFSGLVAIQKDHALVTTGPYSVIRHPSYLGLVVTTLGWVLAFRSGIGVGLALGIIPPLIARIRSEEALLRAQFGAAYDAYSKRTYRLLPGIY